MKFKPKQIYHGIPSGSSKILKIHIDHVISSIYNDQKLIIYRVWLFHKKYWGEFLCTNHQMEVYIQFAKEKKSV